MQSRTPNPEDAPRVRRRGLLARWRRDDSGATAVELGMIALPFFGILFGIIQLGYRFFAAEALDTAVAESARSIMTGVAQSNSGITSASQFRDTVMCNDTRRLVPSFMDCSKLVVDVRRLASFNDAAFTTTAVDLLNGAATTYDPGTCNSTVVVRAAYGLPAVVPGLTGGGAYSIGGSEVYALLGVFVFKNEPFC